MTNAQPHERHHDAHRRRVQLLVRVPARVVAHAALHIVCHTVWSCDNFTYAQFSSPDISTAQRLWHWVGFISVDAQLMAAVVAIAQAIDALSDAHLAQARLEVRVEQIKNEKERLMWDTALREHRTIVGPPFSHWDDTQSSSQGGRPARSHHGPAGSPRRGQHRGCFHDESDDSARTSSSSVFYHCA